MSYRGDLDVLEQRIEELLQQIAERKRERDALNAAQNIGPEARQLFSRLMYWLGRAIGRVRSRRLLIAHPRAIEAARQKVHLLESRLALLEEEVRRARR